MIIKSLTYWQHPNKPLSWRIDNCLFHPALNLIVGKNASGKTRFINIISNLAALLSGRRTPLFGSGNWEIIFQSDQETEIKYSLFIEDNKVVQEKFIQNNDTLLERDSSGKGKIRAEEVGQKIGFQIETFELAALKKCDSVQHSFLHGLSQWANYLRTYQFGANFGQNSLAIIVEHLSGAEILPTIGEDFDKDPNKIVALYREGIKKFGDKFFAQIKSDMEFIGYDLESITVEPVGKLQSPISLATDIHGIYLKERDIQSKIPQTEISQGMFRALALLIHLNYLQFSAFLQNCILIDDIGEGLDFERASKLVKLILQKFAPDSPKKSQIIMTSNDRFIMNGVPLDYWLLVERMPGGVKIYSKNNSLEIFQEFEFTGLNNFDFLASEYFKG